MYPEKPSFFTTTFGQIVTVTLMLIIFLITIGVLNYLNIIPLSNRYPQLFSWLPHKDLPSPPAQAVIPPSPPQKLNLPCPVLKQFCEGGKNILKDSLYQGLAIEATPSSEIKAVFDGQISATGVNTSTGEKYVVIYQKGQTGLIRYIFKGNILKDGLVKTGEVIGKTSGEVINEYNTIFVFSFADEYSEEDSSNFNYPIDANWVQIDPMGFI